MMISNKKKQITNIFLWSVQIILSVSLISAGCMKLFKSIEELSQIWPWTAHVNAYLVKFTGIIDVVAGLGLVLPAMLRVKTILVPITSGFLIVLMACAAIFHYNRGESITVNIVFGFLALLVLLGRLKFYVRPAS